MTFASLFSGIGAGEICASKLGWDLKFNCEINPFCQQTLKFYFPNAKQYTDIRNTDFSIWRGHIDVLAGGPPCQSASVAGQRKGTSDDRFLWPEYIRAVKQIAPIWIVAENVPGLISLEGGVPLDQVLSDLEAASFELQIYQIPAAGTNAPHKRDRLWIIGYSKHNGSLAAEVRRDDSQPSITTRKDEVGKSTGADSLQSSDATHADGDDAGRYRHGETGSEETESQREGNKRERVRSESERTCSERFVTDAHFTKSQGVVINGGAGGERQAERESGQPSRPIRSIRSEYFSFAPVCREHNVLSRSLDTTTISDSAELEGISFNKWRTESIKAYGNAWHVDVPMQIFNVINQMENEGLHKT